MQTVPEELTTISKLRALIEDHLKAEGFFSTTVIIKADAAEGTWRVEDFSGGDEPVSVMKALYRLIPELQKRFRL